MPYGEISRVLKLILTYLTKCKDRIIEQRVVHMSYINRDVQEHDEIERESGLNSFIGFGKDIGWCNQRRKTYGLVQYGAEKTPRCSFQRKTSSGSKAKL